MNITLSYECNSQGIDHFSKYSKMDMCCSLEHHWSQSVGLSLLNEKDKKVLSFIGKPNANIIFTLSRPISKDSGRWWLYEILFFLKLLKVVPPSPRTKSHPFFPLFNERPSPRFLFICGLGSDGLFYFLKRRFRESTNRQIGSLGDSQPPFCPNEIGWIKSIRFFIDSRA